jgi:glycosyltransferase involved in cell wall biosynthesis
VTGAAAAAGGAATRVLAAAVDATPLLGPRTGIGRYVEHLLRELATAPDLRLAAVAFTWRGRDGLAGELPAAVAVGGRRAPARALQASWARTPWPPAEWLTGAADVLHGTNFVLPPARRAAGVLTVHDLGYLRFPGLVRAASLRYQRLVPRGLRRAALALTPTEAVAGELREAYGLPADRVRVTPLGVDPAWAAVPVPDREWLAARGLPADYLLAVGTLEPRKGLDVLLAGYAALLAQEPDAPPLVLVGPAGWGPELDATRLPPDRLRLPGYLPDDDLRRVVAGARLLAFPSRYEGFGLPPLEAMAAGVPVVASDLPAVREVTGGLAALVPAGDPDALAGALLAELRSPAGADRRAAARQRALSHTWARCAELTAAAYRAAAS